MSFLYISHPSRGQEKEPHAPWEVSSRMGSTRPQPRFPVEPV